MGHERKRKKKQREKDVGKRGKGKKRQRQSSSDEASASDTETHQPSSSRTRSVRPPSRYRDEETADSDESDTVCIICGCREPPVKDSIVFWVDCDSCGEWAHTHCALGCTQLHVTLFVYPVASSFVVIINVIFWCFFTVGDIRRKPRIIATLD